MTKQKLLIVLTLAVAGAMLLVACGAPPAPASEAPATDAPAADPLRAYEGTTLRLALKQGYETTAIENYIQDFEDKTGINVEYEVYDEPTLREKFVLDSTAQTGTYDVVAVQFWYFPEYDKAGWLEPLDDYVTNDSIDGWLDVGEIPDAVKASFVGKEDGKLYSIPVSAAGGVLTYRADVLEALGIPAPVSVKDVVTAAALVKEGRPELYGWIGRGESSFASFSTSAGWAWAYGARVLDESNSVTVDTPEMLEAMTDFVALNREFGPPDQASLGWDAETPIFCADGGGAAFNFEMSGFPGFWMNPANCAYGENLGMAILTGPGNHAPQWFYAEALSISKFSNNKEAAWLFLQWRMSPDILLREVTDGIRLDIPYNAVLTDPAYLAKAEETSLDDYVAMLPDILNAVDMRSWPSVPEFVKVAEAFQQEISLAIAGEQTVEEALAKAQTNIEQIMREAGY
jgi:ABC-type glycerol-3-phosphate transport system substrate-binding protein